MISLDAALQAYIQILQPLAIESVPPDQALHHILAGPATARADLPRFDQSAMDGYALRAEDTEKAPTRLKITHTSAAGAWPQAGLQPGAAWRIYTGAAVPDGADTVIPQEHVGRNGDELVFDAPWPAGKNIRYRGEEIPQGAQLAAAGQRLTPGLIASLCNAGVGEVQVYRQPRVSLLVTGDEVRPPGVELQAGEIPDSNGAYIRNWLLANGYAAPGVRYVSDDKHTVSDMLAEAASQADLIITTGGASVGDRDFIPDAARELGFKEIFWKVAQKPGKPLFFGLRKNQPLLGLPGNPGAVLVGMEVHARTVLNRLQDMDHPGPQWRSAVMADTVNADARRDRLLRMQLEVHGDGRCRLLPLGKQDSHMLSNLGQADVLAWLPSSDQDYEAGEAVRYMELTQ